MAGLAACKAKLSGLQSWEALLKAQATSLGLHNYEMVLLQGNQELRRWQMTPQHEGMGEPIEQYLDGALEVESLSAVSTVNREQPSILSPSHPLLPLLSPSQLTTTERMVDSLTATLSAKEAKLGLSQVRKGGCLVM